MARLVADHGNTERLKHLEGLRQIEECLRARTHHDDRMARHRTEIRRNIKVQLGAAMHAADAARCKDADPSESRDGDRCRNCGDASALRRHRNREIAFGELLVGGKDKRLVMRLNARPKFAINDSSYCRHCASRANRSVNAIKALAVIGGGKAHL